MSNVTNIADEMRVITQAYSHLDTKSLDDILDEMRNEGSLHGDEDLLDDYMRDFGMFGNRIWLGSINLFEMRKRIANDSRYTNRCKSIACFADCFSIDEAI